MQGEKIFALAGSMVAYDGQMKFEKAILGGSGGLFGAMKRAVTREGVPLMVANGNGVCYFAKDAHEVNVIELSGNKLFVESSSLLAFESALKTDVVFRGLRGMTSGQGLFTTSIEGRGSVALLSYGPLIALEVSGAAPLYVDPDAFVAFQGQLTQDFVFDVNWKNFIGQGSGESFQLCFSGTGTVFIQPAERH